MNIVNDLWIISKNIDNRTEPITVLNWNNSNWIGLWLDSNRQYTISNPVSIVWKSTFWCKDMIVNILWNQSYNSTKFRNWTSDFVEANSFAAKWRFNNINIGKVKICEHSLALQQIGLNLKYCISEDNFPTFDNCSGDILKAIAPYIIENGESDFITVRKPIMFKFDNWWYFILTPDEWDKKLIVDHQISYDNILWTQRVIIDLNPKTFSYIANARTPAYKFRTKIAKILLWKLWSIPYFWFNYDNVVFVDKDSVLNPNENFVVDWINLEIILHEIIDKIAPLSLLKWWKFVWKITTLYTNHKKDLEVMKYIQNNDLLVDIN